MSKVKLETCGGVGIEGKEEASIEMEGGYCDFKITIEMPKGSTSYRLSADRLGNLFVTTIDLKSIVPARDFLGNVGVYLDAKRHGN